MNCSAWDFWVAASRNSALRFAAAFIFLPCAAMVGCNRAQSQDVGAKPAPPEVFFALPLVRQVTDHEDFNGSTQAIRTVQIRARVSGYLDKVNFVEGAMVNQGDVLCEVDARPYQAAYESSVGQVHLTEAVLKQSKADNDRAKGLAGTPGAISQQDRDKFQAAEEQAQATLETAKANLATSKLNLTFSKVLAPFSGRISQRMVDPGNLVVADTTLLTTLVTEDPIYAYFFVDEHTLLRVRRLNEKNKVKSMQDTHPEVQLGLADEGDEFPHKGTINFEDNQVDPQTGTLRLRGVFPNTDRLLSPGLFVRVRLPIGPPHDALVIPEQALGTDQGRKYLYVVDDKNIAQYRPVAVGSTFGEGMRVVTEGLKPDDRVVVNGLQRVRPGNPVTPKPAPPKAEPSKAESPKVDAAKLEAARIEAAKIEAAKIEAARIEAAKNEPPKSEAPKPAPKPEPQRAGPAKAVKPPI